MTPKPFSEWYEKHFREQILAPWLRHAPGESGLFRVAFDRAWQPNGPPAVTPVSQGRLLFIFAEGWRITGEKACVAAVQKGAEFLLKRFRDRAHGGWFTLLDTEGRIIDDAKGSVWKAGYHAAGPLLEAQRLQKASATE
jgi:mannose/cellobiose epimerase-like protein (N-acyl-D-glucosamine 2-epimerase family)